MKIGSVVIFDTLLKSHTDGSFLLIIKHFDKKRQYCEASSLL